jgi:lipopolysaccharide export system ATP-binding protein
LQAVRLEKSFGKRQVVKGIDLYVSKGEVVGLLGPNGAGKTTTFYMITGLIKPDNGHIYLGGEDLTRMAMYQRAQKGLSYLPQEHSVFRRLTAKENIMAVMELRGIPEAERKRRTERLIEEFHLEAVADTMAYALSGGEQRRVEIARALALSPKVLLLDEPFAGIDPIVVAELQQLVVAMKKKGIGIIITDHNVRETLKITDRAYIINKGEILAQGIPETIANNTQVRCLYLGEDFEL